MNRAALLLALVQTTLLVVFTAGMVGRWWPLGVPREWEWLRLGDSNHATTTSLVLALGAVGGLAGLAAAGARSLARWPSIGKETAWVGVLAIGSVLGQALVQEGAPPGFGLAKWIVTLRNEGSSGYLTKARREMPAGLGPFLRDYPNWIARQDSLHIGTHPPGLFVVARCLSDLAGDHPALARWLVDHAPGSVEPMILAIHAADGLTRAEAAVLILTGGLTLIGSALTVIPLYLLVRATSAAAVAWAAAVLWPFVPSAILFQPTADTAFPLLATAALAAAAWSVRIERRWLAGSLAVGSGVLLAVGMELTLAFLAVGLIVAAILGATPGSVGWKPRLSLIGLTGLGFVAATLAWWGLTGANPVAIWWVNQAHHAEFYHEHPRSRLAWSLVNPIETAVGLGLASVVLAVANVRHLHAIATASWATLAVLILLTVSGRSLSEVARLWLLLYPPLLTLAAQGWERLGSNSISLGLTVLLVGLQTVGLQLLIQVVYPV